MSKSDKKAIIKRLPQKGRPVKKSRLAKQGRDKIKITPQELAFLEAKSDEGLSLKKLQVALKDKFGKEISHTTISTILKENGYRKPIVKKSQIPIEYLFILRYDKRLTLAEMEAITGMSKSSLHYHLDKSNNQNKYLSNTIFAENKVNALQFKQHDLFTSLTKDKIKNMGGRELVSAITQLEEKIRLLKGESTEILTLEGLDKGLSDLDAEELRIRKALNITPSKETFSEDAELEKLNKQIIKLEKGLDDAKKGKGKET